MMNPNTKALKGPAGPRFPNCCNHFLSNSRLSWRLASSQPRESWSAQPGQVPGPASLRGSTSRAVREGHLGTAHRESPAGSWLGRTGSSRRPRPLQCNLGGFPRSLLASFRAQFQPPRRPRAGEGNSKILGLRRVEDPLRSSRGGFMTRYPEV